MRGENDELTISLLLCKQRNRLMAEYGARGFAPIGVAEYRLIEALAGSLPSVEDIERDAAAPAVKPADDEGSRGALKTFFAQAMGMSP
ncbi:MAG: hypothetical protein EOP82_20855 [Variovorax sp.]|nr:MAG: hypothetical protein EOP82_20855 [Variovorax sp.]